MFGVASEDANACRVKGRHPHFFCDRTHQRCDSVFHFLGGFVGERDGKDLKWVDVVFLNEVGNAVGEDPCFP